MRLAANSELQNTNVDMPGMKSPLIKSGLFHIALILVFTVGIPFISPPPPMTMAPPITVELVDISEMTTTPRVAPPQKPKEEPKPPEPTPKVEAPPKVNTERPPDLSKPTPPETETAEATPPPEPPKPLERVPEPKPEPPKPKEEPKPKPPEPKKPEPEVTKKVEPKPQEDDFQSLLKNILPDEKKPVEGDEIADKEVEPQEGQIAQISEKLSISEQDALRKQLSGCWNVLAGAKFAEELVVEIRVDMNRDRTVNRASILDQGRYNRDNHYRAAADAAMRALRNPKCIPLALPPDKYDQWKTTLIRFDPRDML